MDGLMDGWMDGKMDFIHPHPVEGGRAAWFSSGQRRARKKQAKERERENRWWGFDRNRCLGRGLMTFREILASGWELGDGCGARRGGYVSHSIHINTNIAAAAVPYI